MRNKKSIFVQGIRFSIVGISNAFIGLGLIYVLYNVFHVNYKLSNIIGYFCGFINSFIWNKLWTFKSKKNLLKEFVLFTIVFSISFSLNYISVVFCVEKLKINPNIAQLFGVIFYTSTNFFGNKLLTFK